MRIDKLTTKFQEALADAQRFGTLLIAAQSFSLRALTLSPSRL